MTSPRFPDVGLAAATYLEMGLTALGEGNVPRAVGCLAAIDGKSWEAIVIRFPDLPARLAPYYARQAERS